MTSSADDIRGGNGMRLSSHLCACILILLLSAASPVLLGIAHTAMGTASVFQTVAVTTAETSLQAPISRFPVIIDGFWKDDNEWDDAPDIVLSSSDMACHFRIKHDSSFVYLLLDFVADQAIESGEGDAGDRVDVKFDVNHDHLVKREAGPDFYVVLYWWTNQQFRILQGLGNEGLTIERSGISAASSLTTTPLSQTPHLVYEMKFDKASYGIGTRTVGIAVEADDASKPKAYFEFPADRDGHDAATWADLSFASTSYYKPVQVPAGRIEPGPAAVAAGAFVSATIASSQVVGDAGQLVWRKMLEALQGKRAEADFEVEKEAKRKMRKTWSRELGSLAAAVLVVASALAYAYAEPRGMLPSVTETVQNIFAAPGLLFEAGVASSAVLVISYLVRLGVANRLKATVEYNLWAVGILMLFVSALLKSPFGAPGEVRTEATSHRVRAEIALSVIFASLATSGLFYFLLKMGFPTEMGVYYGLTLAVASAVPVKPLAGYSIRLYDKKLSGALLIMCFYFFFVHLFEGSEIFGQVWLFLSILAAILFVAVAAAFVSSRTSLRRRKAALPPPTPVPVAETRVPGPLTSVTLPRMEKKYCVQCGAQIDEWAQFCTNCGGKQPAVHL